MLKPNALQFTCPGLLQYRSSVQFDLLLITSYHCKTQQYKATDVVVRAKQ